jgi:hypothetical protein
LELYVRSINAEFPRKSIGPIGTSLHMSSPDLHSPGFEEFDQWNDWGQGWGRGSGIGDNLVDNKLSDILNRLSVRKEKNDACLIYDPYTRGVFLANEEFVRILSSFLDGSPDSTDVQKLVNLVRKFYDV